MNGSLKCVRVRGEAFQYDARYDGLRPYAYFDINKSSMEKIYSVARMIEKRCRRVFKTAEIASFKAKPLWPRKDIFEVRVNFSISETERLDYEQRRMEKSQ